MLNKIEVFGDAGVWLLWLNNVKEENLGKEVFRALQMYEKVRVNNGKIYSVSLT